MTMAAAISREQLLPIKPVIGSASSWYSGQGRGDDVHVNVHSTILYVEGKGHEGGSLPTTNERGVPKFLVGRVEDKNSTTRKGKPSSALTRRHGRVAAQVVDVGRLCRMMMCSALRQRKRQIIISDGRTGLVPLKINRWQACWSFFAGGILKRKRVGGVW